MGVIGFQSLFTNCDNSVSKEATLKEQSDSIPVQAEKVDQKRFPNKRSELAILMRNIYDDLKTNKDRIKNNDSIAINWMKKYESILTAKPTDEDDSGPVFNGFAHKFLNDLSSFQSADSNARVTVYNALINSCIDCHKSHCQGPIPAIKKLKV